MLLIRCIVRGLRPCVAAALVASLVTTMLGPLAHADDGHDADFGPAIVHDASQHRLTPGSPHAAAPAVEQHCVACHVVRLVRDNPVTGLSVQPFILSVASGYGGAGHILPQISGPPLPARAPPVSLFA